MAARLLKVATPRYTTKFVLPPCRCLSRTAVRPSSTTPNTPSCNPPYGHPRIFRSSVFRTFNSSSPQFPLDTVRPSRETQSFPDPDRPDLFYHLFPPPTALSSSIPLYALSFLPHAPESVTSRTVIGWLPASTGNGHDGAGLNDFRENASFRELLHDALQSALRDDADEVQRNSAIQTQQGWMHINDDRNVPAIGRIGDPDDILASVRVEEGKILADTYQPMPSYRLCTSDGIMKLSDGLAARLKEWLEAAAEREVPEAPLRR